VKRRPKVPPVPRGWPVHHAVWHAQGRHYAYLACVHCGLHIGGSAQSRRFDARDASDALDLALGSLLEHGAGCEDVDRRECLTWSTHWLVEHDGTGRPDCSCDLSTLVGRGF